MRFFTLILALLSLAGCAVQTGIIATGKDTFMELKQGSGFWTSPSTLVAEVTQDAGRHCANQNKALKIINIRQEGVGIRPGAYPEAEIHFSCE